MIDSRAKTVRLIGCLVFAVHSSGIGMAAVGSSPAITSGQIEADWRRQDALRNSSATTTGKGVTPQQDAAGGCDGVKNGKWGFHTEHENQPWWQVDLGRSMPLQRVVLYNRCDSGTAGRNSRIMVLLSEDGKTFKKVYEHDGTVFLGQIDNKPLSVPMGGQKARVVRVQLPGKSYFHLDEVEIYTTTGKKNVALFKPATQSSTSQWSVRHRKGEAKAIKYFTQRHIERGLKLARNLRQLGADVDSQLETLEQVAETLKQLPNDSPQETRQKLDRRVRWAVRRMALKNPLLDFDEILFVKRAPGMFPHVCDQYYGWWSRGGGGIDILSGFKGENPQVRCLTEDWPEGSFLRPELSHDAKKVLFAWCKYHPHVAGMEKVDKEKLPEDAFYHIFEMNIDGSGVRQLTRGYYDDFDARYLPNGQIVFLSTRKGLALQAGKQSARATTASTRPDSYVRCGGGNRRPVAVFTLHVIDSQGKNLRAISAFENFEWTPSVANDGRILYARWDYIDRFNGYFMSLWSTNPDGTNPQLVYGNYTKKPQCIFEAQAIPNSRKLIFTATAHHSITGGSLVLLDRNLGSEYERPLTRLTPEVAFPETEGWPETYYAGPHPLSEEHFLVSWSDRRLPAHRLMPPDDPRNPRNALGLYLYDAFGNLTLLHRDPDISSMNPIPIRPRKRPPALANTVDWDGPQEGRFLLQDVYQGLAGVERGSVKSLRVIGVPPKVQPQMNRPVLGVSREDPGKFVLGTVPVEEDGSAYFRVPSGIPVFFQALDGDGLAVQTMRSLTYVQPNQTLSCIGCHESRGSSPSLARLPKAAGREPSRLRPGPSGSWPLRFDRLVGPVLSSHCVSCHRPHGDDPQAARFDLTPAKAYESLIEYADGDLRKLAFEKDQSVVGDCPARKSKLLDLLTQTQGHGGVRLETEEFERLTTWMDTYAQRLGSYSDDQEERLRQLKRRLAFLLSPAALFGAGEDRQQDNQRRDLSGKACKVLADKRLQGPLKAIVKEFQRRTGDRISLRFLPAAKVNALVEKKETGSDAVLCMAMKRDGKTSLDSLPGAKRVAWKHPSGEPVWGATLTEHPQAAGFVRFVGGPTGHRLWSESKAGFTITTGKTHAEAFDWVVEHRVKHTYPLTAMRMLREIGGIRDGICIDVGCGTGNLDVELAKRSNFTIIGLDIDPDMKPLFEKRVGEARLQDRLRFVTGDAQKMPFPDNYANVIVSRGTLTFIPDIGKCLREVDRVLKPTGVAFLGGRYLYTPQADKISNEKLKKIVRESGVPGARVVEHRGQWVKIIGPKAPKAAHQFQAGPHMLANRFIADYAITEGKCLLICMNDGGGTQGLQQGFLEMTELQITVLYPSEKVVGQAEKRIREAKLTNRIACKVGTLDALPFDEASFDLVAGVGPVLIWGERQKKMREIYRVLRRGGAALVGGRYLGMPDFRKVSSETLRSDAVKTGITSIRVSDDMGQWIEIRKGIKDSGSRD